MEHPIRIGPAGWSYTDWEGTVYPPHRSRFDHLAYLSSFFDTIEINSPFYRVPPPTHAKSWVRRASGDLGGALRRLSQLRPACSPGHAAGADALRAVQRRVRVRASARVQRALSFATGAVPR